tara:strand:- start:330 stop:1271 length:942 start_codon:yes stop_codon:yes gene_type:complete
LEELILRFYLKIFSILLIPIIYFFYILFIKDLVLNNKYFLINKNDNYHSIIYNNISDSSFNLFFYKLVLRISLLNNQIHYGKFVLNKNLNYYKLLNTIKLPSNYYEKITIVEGWSKNDLNKILLKNFDNFYSLEYSDIIADTYMFSEGSSFEDFKKQLDKKYIEIKNKYKNHNLLKKFSFNEILIIGSLLEKEGLDNDDKRLIYSVIINRLNSKMKLQIDATVIFSITKGYKDLDRNLNFDDLKINDPYNTYFIFGLPPKPISYVGYKTIEIIFENYKSDYLFYFYNSLENKHIFSLNYKKHLEKLNAYRAKK